MSSDSKRVFLQFLTRPLFSLWNVIAVLIYFYTFRFSPLVDLIALFGVFVLNRIGNKIYDKTRLTKTN